MLDLSKCSTTLIAATVNHLSPKLVNYAFLEEDKMLLMQMHGDCSAMREKYLKAYQIIGLRAPLVNVDLPAKDIGNWARPIVCPKKKKTAESAENVGNDSRHEVVKAYLKRHPGAQGEKRSTELNEAVQLCEGDGKPRVVDLKKKTPFRVRCHRPVPSAASWWPQRRQRAKCCCGRLRTRRSWSSAGGRLMPSTPFWRRDMACLACLRFLLCWPP